MDMVELDEWRYTIAEAAEKSDFGNNNEHTAWRFPVDILLISWPARPINDFTGGILMGGFTP